ncbi:MAG: hypothetical protein IJB79_02205 [Candidatus Gastranaerophilales bacterium]|nr:hypothetical protein [Candidatus Gastranaerophilales bacterium]
MNISPVSCLNFKNVNFLNNANNTVSNAYNSQISFCGNKEIADKKASETLEMLEYIDSKSQEVFKKAQMFKEKQAAQYRPCGNAFYFSREDGKEDSYWFNGDKLIVSLGRKDYSGILKSVDERFIFEDGKLIEYRKNEKGATGYGFDFSQAEVHYLVDKNTGNVDIHFNEQEPFDDALKALRKWY